MRRPMLPKSTLMKTFYRTSSWARRWARFFGSERGKGPACKRPRRDHGSRGHPRIIRNAAESRSAAIPQQGSGLHRGGRDAWFRPAHEDEVGPPEPARLPIE
jgi:hypothetical protein